MTLMPLWKSAPTMLLLVLVVTTTACGGPENLPPDKVIEKAAAAMRSTPSFHFSLETSKLQKALPGLFISGGEGDVVKPDKLSAEVQAAFGGIPLNSKVVVDGKQQYMTDPVTGKWTTMAAAVNIMQFFDPAKGISDILAGVKDLKSDGTESINGTDTYRLNATAPATALKSLSSEVTATGDLTTTLWVGASDFLLRRVRINGPLMSSEPDNIVRTISFSDYGKEFKVETPVVGK